MLASTRPAGGAPAWHTTPVDTGPFPDGGVQGLQCPSAKLCAGYLPESGRLVTATSPAGGASAWHTTALPVERNDVLTTLDCPAASLCVAGTGGGQVLASTDPAGGASAWHVVTPAVGEGNILSMACAKATKAVCAATDSENDLVTSGDPAGPASGWQGVALPNTDRLSELACPGTSLCFAIGYVNEKPAVWYSTDPAGGAATWQERATSATSSPVTSFTCVSARFCIGPWLDGARTGVTTSVSPTGKNAWTATQLRQPVPGYRIGVVACASSRLCVAGDSRGDLYTGRGRSQGP